MLKAATHHALRRGVLEFELRGKIGVCGNLGGSGTGAVEPCADSVIGQLGAVVDDSGVDLAVADLAGLVDAELYDVGHAVLVFIQRGNAFGKHCRQHGKDLDSGVDRSGFAFGVTVENRAPTHSDVNIGDANEDADAAIRQLLGPFDLIKIFGCVVINGGPEKAAHILRAGSGGELGMGLDGGQLGIRSSGKIGLESVLDHGGVSGCNKIELRWLVIDFRWLAGLHLESGSLKLPSQPTMSTYCGAAASARPKACLRIKCSHET